VHLDESKDYPQKAKRCRRLASCPLHKTPSKALKLPPATRVALAEKLMPSVEDFAIPEIKAA
jgi:hypothetical protein